MGWLLAGAAIFAAGAVLLAGTLRVRASVMRMRNDDSLSLEIKGLFGLLNIRRKVSFADLTGAKDGFSLEWLVETGTTWMERSADVDLESLKQLLRKRRRALVMADGFLEWLTETMADIVCTRFSWKTNVGLGDAPGTAMAAGLAWALQTTVSALFLNRVRLQTQPQFAVYPVYNEVHFSTQLTVHCHIRLGTFLAALGKLLLRTVKAKGGLKKLRGLLAKRSAST